MLPRHRGRNTHEDNLARLLEKGEREGGREEEREEEEGGR